MDLTNILNKKEPPATKGEQSTNMSSPEEDQKTGTYLEREVHIQSPAPHSDLTSDAGSPHTSASPSLSEHSSQYLNRRPASSASQTGSMYSPLQQPHPPPPRPPQHHPQYHQQHIQATPLSHYQNNQQQQQQQYNPLAQQHSQYYALQQQHEQQQHHEHEMHLQQQQLLQQHQQQPQLLQQDRFEEPQRETKPASSSGQVKSQVCGTCSKAFARRSDLARHERIHSGHRPHVCDHAGCGKQFIQRSALTVHARVHTGEKPHMCETCSKPFSDSSSLARHRRIHSGKRPFKCPFADCQKTFTRRTTLTRHQHHHSGTIEESQARTQGQLLTGPVNQVARGQSVTPAYDSNPSSGHSTPSSNTRTESMSPGVDMTSHYHQQHDFFRSAGAITSHPASHSGALMPHPLTRHQHHHSGTIEESQARTQGQLLTGPMNQVTRGQSGTPAYDSNPSSCHSTPSPNTRTESMSPGVDITPHYHQQHDFFRSAGAITSHPAGHSGALMPHPMTPQPTPTQTPTMGRPNLQPTSHPYPLPQLQSMEPSVMCD